MLPFSLPKSAQVASNIDLGGLQNFDPRWNRFFDRPESILKAKTAPRGRQEGAKSPQIGGPPADPPSVKTAQDGPTAPRGPPSPPGRPIPPFGGRFGSLLARFGHPTWPSQPTKIFEKSFPTRPRFLIPTCLHFTSQNMSKTFQKSI